MPNEFIARNGLIAQKDSSITGSLNVTNGITGSLFGTSSFASTASWVKNAQTASYFSGSITNAISASFATTASYLEGSITSASFASTASYAISASWAPNSGGSITTSDNLFIVNGSVLSASKALNILTDNTTITWYVSSSYNAKVTLGGATRSLVISGSQDGDYYSLLVVQDSTGNRILYVPIDSLTSSSVNLNPSPNSSTTLVTWYRSGSYEWRSTASTQSNSQILSSNYTTAATSASNTPLAFAIQPFEAYYCVLEGSCQKATTATGLKFGISTPTGSTILGEQWGPGTSNLTMVTRSLITSSNLLQTINTATGLRQPFRLTFMVQNSSSAGFVTIQLATVTSNVATLFSGSRFIYEKANMV